MSDDQGGAGSARGSGDSIQASVERLVASGKDMAEAEIAWAKLRGRSIAAILRKGLLFSVIAVSGLMVGMSLLLVAGIVALAPKVGLLYATLIVIGVAFAIAFIFGWLARNAFHEMMGSDES